MERKKDKPLETKGATCGICGKELFDEKNMEEHYKEEHKELSWS